MQEHKASTDDTIAPRAAVSACAAQVDSLPAPAGKSDHDLSSSFDSAADLKVVRNGAPIPQSNAYATASPGGDEGSLYADLKTFVADRQS